MADEAAFKIGDVVELKSGSPAMTIAGLPDTHGGWYCTWWNPNDYKIDGTRLKADLLKLSSADRFPTT
jgi:uncharacterized protein YodC (DUF2158 family)